MQYSLYVLSPYKSSPNVLFLIGPSLSSPTQPCLCGHWAASGFVTARDWSYTELMRFSNCDRVDTELRGVCVAVPSFTVPDWSDTKRRNTCVLRELSAVALGVLPSQLLIGPTLNSSTPGVLSELRGGCSEVLPSQFLPSKARAKPAVQEHW